MKKTFILIVLFFALASCVHQSQSSLLENKLANFDTATTSTLTKTFTDSTVSLFGNDDYKLTLKIFDSTNNYDAEKKNAVLIFYKQNGNQNEVFFRDSIFCMFPFISFQDFNNDKIEDVLVFYYTGARANPTYHLYLTDPKNHSLIRIKGFEELPNPDLGTKDNIITSIALSGTNYYRFYRINARNKLINLGHDFIENTDDIDQYENAIRRINKKK